MCGNSNPLTSIPSAIGNEVEQTVKLYAKDPERPLLGINTPAETTIWGNILGKDYTPTTDMMGSVDTEHNRDTAAAHGIKTGPQESMHGIAKAVTAIFGGAALGGLAAGGEAATGAGAETLGAEGGEIAGASGGSTAAGGGEAAADSVAQAQAAGATSAGSSSAPAEAFGSDVGEMMPAATPQATTASSAAASPAASSPSSTPSLLSSLKTAATVLTPVSSLLAAASGVSASKKAAAAKAPQAAAPVPMPDTTNGKGVLSAPVVQRAAIQDQLARRGRASTILTSANDKLGG